MDEVEQVYQWFKSLTPEEQTDVLDSMPKQEREELLEIVDELDTRDIRKEVSADFLSFVKEVWPDFIAGKHHAWMAQAFEEVASGKCKRLIINMPDRKSNV